MTITPLEIRQHNFNKAIRGFDTEEVKAFLLTLSHEWEHLQEEIKNQKKEIESTKTELAKLKEVESALHETLMQAKQSSQHTIENAEKTASIKIQEATLESERIINQALSEKKRFEEEIAALKKRVHSELIELTVKRDDILEQMHSFLQSQLERLKRFESKQMSSPIETRTESFGLARSDEKDSPVRIEFPQKDKRNFFEKTMQTPVKGEEDIINQL